MPFDPRILTVEIQFDDGTKIYAGPLNIKASGSKTILSMQNTCNIQISNLQTNERDYLLANCNQNLAASYKVRRVIVQAGRQSIGAWDVYHGDIVQAGISQPPDVTMSLRATTNARDRTQYKAFSNQTGQTLQAMAQDLANQMNLSLQIDPSVNANYVIPRYTYNGTAAGMMVRLQELGGPAATDGSTGGVRIWVDDTVLKISNWKKGLANTSVQINKNTGMVGIPEFTEYGIRVRTLADRSIVLGGGMTLVSEKVPVMNADYVITRIDYDLSTRDQQFYYDVWANRSG